MERSEQLNALFEKIELDTSIEKCEAVLDADPETREEVFLGIAKKLTIGWGQTMGEIMAMADQNYEYPRHTDEHKCADTIFELHNLLCLPDNLKSDEEIESGYEDFEIETVVTWFEKDPADEGKPDMSISKMIAYPEPELKSRQWLFRCEGEAIVKTTEKAVCVDLGGEATAWIPKSVIWEFWPGQKNSPSGLIIKDWFARKDAQSGSPYCQINWQGKLI